MAKKLTLDEYKLQALEHGVRCIADKYLGDKEPILHQCLKDQSHEWLVRPNDVKQDHKCPCCARIMSSLSQKLTLDEYKLQALEHGSKCIAIKYLGDSEPILHQCLKDSSHVWSARPHGIKQDHGCPMCAVDKIALKLMLTLDEYKLQALERGVRCIATEYLDSEPILHQCLKDPSHAWSANPGSVKQDHGCPYCNNLKQEPRCRAWFEKFFQRSFPKIRPRWLVNRAGYHLELDGYCEELKLAFEYNGIQHYASHKGNFRGGEEMFQKIQANDIVKKDLCSLHDITLIVVPYLEKEIEKYLEDRFATNYMAF